MRSNSIEVLHKEIPTLYYMRKFLTPLLSMQSDGEESALLAAAKAKEQGTEAVRGGRCIDAFKHYSRGVYILLREEDVALLDYGLVCPPTLTSVLTAEAKALAAVLLTNRAATALKFSPARTFRALADTALALALAPGPKAAFRRAQALLAVGACAMASETLRPYATAEEPQLRSLMERSQRRDARASWVIGALASQELRGTTPQPHIVPSTELNYIGTIAVCSLDGAKRRGWVATARIEVGGLISAECSAFPRAAPPAEQGEGEGEGGEGGDAWTAAYRSEWSDSSSDSLSQIGGAGADDALPLFSLLARRLTEPATAADADGLREALCCMHPLRGEGGEMRDPPTRRDALAAPRVAAIAAVSGLGVDDGIHIERVVQRNQMALKLRVGGELRHFGTGLYPLTVLTNHSCHPNAVNQPLHGGRAMVMHATRTIEPGEEITLSYTCTSLRGPARRAGLQASHGFRCCCERCAAPAGSALYEIERDELALVCPTCNADGCRRGPSEPNPNPNLGRGMLPDSPYNEGAGFGCAEDGCGRRLNAAEASRRVRTAHESFVVLSAPLREEGEAARRQELSRRCDAARAAEAAARSILGRYHHEWGAWIANAMPLADAADDTALMLLAYARKEALLAPGRAADDEDIITRVNHAITVGVETDEGAAALCSAFDQDRARACGCADVACADVACADVDEFVARWIPSDFEGLGEAVRPILSRHAATPHTSSSPLTRAATDRPRPPAP